MARALHAHGPEPLEFYHWEPNAASARVLICLAEKGCPFTSHYIDVLGFEQHRAPFLRLNERGEVPVLVHAGVPYTQASYICEYLEELAPGLRLMPSDPHARWRVRSWQKYVDDVIAPCVGELTWQAYGVPLLRDLDRGVLAAAVSAIPVRERREHWMRVLTGLTAEALARATERIETALTRVLAELERGEWLAGNEYTLADIAAFGYLNYLPRLWRERVNRQTMPRLMEWLERIGSRPAVRVALATGHHEDPYSVAAPGPEQIRWG